MVPLNVKHIFCIHHLSLQSYILESATEYSFEEKKGKCHFLCYDVEFRLRKNEIITSESTFYIEQLPF